MMDSISRWWWYVALYVISFIGIVFLVPIVGTRYISSFSLLPAIGVVIYLTAPFLLPLTLFLDARAVRNAEVEWNPNPFLYGIGGLVLFIIFLRVEIAVYIGAFGSCLISVIYIAQRVKNVGLRR